MASQFSFRIFDMMKRFVQILQKHPAYLKDFKSGNPHKDTCQKVLNKTFHKKLPEERTKQMIIYLKKHSKFIANQAEDLPRNWNQAIEVTNRSIKIIRKILNGYGITVKTFVPNVSLINKLVPEMARAIHGNEFTSYQLQAIKDYLMYDIKHSKRTIVRNLPFFFFFINFLNILYNFHFVFR